MPASPGSGSVGRAASGRSPDPLDAVGLGKRFGSVVALADVSFRVPRGAVVGLMGPNGSGKSTLIGVAAGLVRADRGTVLVAGVPAGTVDAARHLAVVPDEPSGLDELTTHEQATLLFGLHRSRDAPGRWREIAETFGVDGLRNRCLGSLSRGQRRRAALAAAFALDVRLLLVDEATATLDEAAVDALCDALAGATRRGAGVLLATHDRAFVSDVCDTVLELREGEVAAELQFSATRVLEGAGDAQAR